MDMDYLYGTDEKGNMAYFYGAEGVLDRGNHMIIMHLVLITLSKIVIYHHVLPPSQ